MSTPISPKFDEPPAEPHYRKPQADVYTVLLVISLLAILLATVVLWLVMQTYDYKIKGGPVAVSVEHSAVSNQQSAANSQGSAVNASREFCG